MNPYTEHLRAAANDAAAPEPLRAIARYLAEHAGAIADALAPATLHEIAARAELAELASAVEDFRRACEFDPNFQALPTDHPARRLFRAHERIKVADRALFATQADRTLASATRDEKAAAALDILNRRACGRSLKVGP